MKNIIDQNTEERMEMKERLGRRRKQLLDDVKEKRDYLKWKEEALDRTVWRTGFGTGCGPVVLQFTCFWNICRQEETTRKKTKQLLYDRKIREIEGGSTRSQSVEN
jgi:hypothetical protein